MGPLTGMCAWNIKRGLAGIVVAFMLLGGAQTGALGQTSQAVVHVREGATIIAEGDSLTYGHDLSSSGTTPPINGAPQTRSATPYPETLQKDLGGRVTVVNHGYPGDRTVDGLVRWQEDPPADVVIIMYGANDTGNFRPNHEGRLTPDTYTRVLLDLVRRSQAAGAAVIVVAAPPARDAQTDSTIEPYRLAARAAALKAGAVFVDPKAVLDPSHDWWTDGLHLTPSGYGAIAEALSRVIQVK